MSCAAELQSAGPRISEPGRGGGEVPKTTFAKQSICAELQGPGPVLSSCHLLLLVVAAPRRAGWSREPGAFCTARSRAGSPELPSLPVPVGLCTELGQPLPSCPAQTFLLLPLPAVLGCCCWQPLPQRPSLAHRGAVSPVPGLSLEPRLQPVTFTAFSSPYQTRMEGRGSVRSHVAVEPHGVISGKGYLCP